MKTLQRSIPHRNRREMLICRAVRHKFFFTDTLLSTDGSLVYANMPAIRKLTQSINNTRNPEENIHPSDLYAAGLLHEASHLLLLAYQTRHRPKLFADALSSLRKEIGEKELYEFLSSFVHAFPPASVYAGQQTASSYLNDQKEGRALTEQSIEEALLLYIANENPATKGLRELIDIGHLQQPGSYGKFIRGMEAFSTKQPPMADQHADIISMLRAPYLSAPESLDAQLEYVLTHWEPYLSPEILFKIKQGQDMIKEDQYGGATPGGPPPPSIVPGYDKQQGHASMLLGRSGFDAVKAASEDYEEPEHFTADTHWMPRVVLLAKNIYVWLDQLSGKYQREIRRLDHIPDEELEELARRHFNGLWLIGLWERSSASQRIKHLTGNKEAAASAYALYDYTIAEDLGGEEAFQNLNSRARHYGIRLASDMVPNHTGVFSKWVIDHPGYFIQTDTPPFPGYTFSGENLSGHPGAEIRIEDGYYDKSDAAVVFQRVDKATGQVSYLYHGNDGTMMPWNDTAQLDMLKAEVREAVMQKIMEVASRFSIIRFDAAMTLAKKHFSRLWYPRPGSGGDIPSRAAHAMSKEAFDALFPVEFWREVVDRINRELPETLLLAEAFWFMEGYFVRTLGMHRVYNSAFMHMLMNEENDKYRDLITNTLEFEPEILKRYVNFMSNPDEETAIQQFGTGDKYFGVCVLMNTLPGLPMFAHGQIEGFTEKYGMEFRAARYHERPDHALVERHEKEVFPLAGKRYLFSEVTYFQIYDYMTSPNQVNENVFAFTNRHGEEKALVMFNNKYESTHGQIHLAAPRLSGHGNTRQRETATLAAALGIKDSTHHYYVAYEHISGLEYLHRGTDLYTNGFYRPLKGFEYRVFFRFDEIFDQDGALGKLCNKLAGEGVPSIEDALSKQKLEGVHQALEQLFDMEAIRALIGEDPVDASESFADPANIESLQRSFDALGDQAYQKMGTTGKPADATAIFLHMLSGLMKAIAFMRKESDWVKRIRSGTPVQDENGMMVTSSCQDRPKNMLLLVAGMAIESMAEASNSKKEEVFCSLKMDWPMQLILEKRGRSDADIHLDILLLKTLSTTNARPFDFRSEKSLLPGKVKTGKVSPAMLSRITVLQEILTMQAAQDFLGVNQYQGVWYYSKEQFEQLNRWLFTMGCLQYFRPSPKGGKNKRGARTLMRQATLLLILLINYSNKAGYRLNRLNELLVRGQAV